MSTGIKVRKIIRVALALVLSALMVVTNPLQSVARAEAADQGGKYLSEVFVSVASTPDEAAKKLEDKGYTVLKKQNEPADLNEGADTLMKDTRAVVLGYKTTGNRDEAISDLAVMNMEGGYSFASYAELMNSYRDSTIKPFIDSFMATVGEYRANTASQNPGNRAKAEFAHSLLNRIVDDDTGGRLGDLLLQQTKAEMGQDYQALSKEEKKTHIDLERALMQGNVEVVLLVEQLLSYAADTSEITWLQRLSELGSSGLEAQYANMRPADAQKQLAGKYRDTASALAEGWDAMRDELLAYEKTILGDVRVNADALPSEGGESAEQPQEEQGTQGTEGEQPQGEQSAESEQSQSEQGTQGEQQQIEVVDPSEQSQAEQDAVVQEGEDEAEVEVAELVQLDIPEHLGEEKEVDISDVPELLNQATTSLKSMNEASDDVNNTKTAALYNYLKSLPYDEGTLYDLFTLPASDIAADNFAMLYPAASCLSAGQVAAIEFLPLQTLLQIGATTGDAYGEVWVEGLGLKEMAEALGDVSLYQGVNREIFSDLTALTSDALRADALQREDTGVLDFLSQYKVTALLWMGTTISAVIAGCSTYKWLQKVKTADAIKAANDQVRSRLNLTKNTLNSMLVDALPNNPTSTGKMISSITVEKIPGAPSDRSLKVTVKTSIPYTETERIDLLSKWSRDGKYVGGTEGNLQINDVYREIENQTKLENSGTKTRHFSEDSGLREGVFDFDGECNRLDNKRKEISKMEKKMTPDTSSFKTIMFGVVFLGLLLASLYSTMKDIQAYYNVTYAPMPRYIVDVADVTTTADDGTKTVTRNDTAYYSAVLTNLERSGNDLVAMMNYADMNGDVGKQWLGLYSTKKDGDPILADSLYVERGTSSLPSQYVTGIHMFGTDAAANLTDARYSYNDDAKGNYVYFMRDSTPAETASVFGSGTAALTGGIGLVVGTALGAGVTAFMGRRRHEADAV